jgi:hypothetical protein
VPLPEGAPAVTDAGAVAGGVVRLTPEGLAVVDAACAAAEGDAAGEEETAGGAVITPAGGLEDGDAPGVGVAEGEGAVPRVAPGGYHCRLPNGIGKASRSRAAGTSAVVKGSGPGLPG